MEQNKRFKARTETGMPTTDPHEALTKVRRMLERQTDTDSTALREIGSRRRENPFEVLISTILSQRTRDENTRRAYSALFRVYKDADDLAEGNLKVIERLIRPVGFYKVKARKIKEVATIISQRYGGEVPQSFEDLLHLPGVGRKTANCVLVYAFGKPAIPVDTHVHRISNRIGLVETKSPEQTELRLREIIDRRYWLDLNELFVRFGQEICKPIGPRCAVCDLKATCKYYNEVVSQAATPRRRRSRE